MPEKIPRPGVQHPPEWRQDLNPTPMGGQNIGTANPHPEQGARTAYDVKELHDQLQLLDEDLKQIPILPEGSRLEQGAVYLDLRRTEDGEFAARGDMVVPPGSWYVPKSSVSYDVWNRLLGREEERP